MPNGGKLGAQPPLPGPTSAGAHFARRPARTVAAIATTVAAIDRDMRDAQARHTRRSGAGGTWDARARPGRPRVYFMLHNIVSGPKSRSSGQGIPRLKKTVINPEQSSATCVFRTKPKGPLFIIFGSRALLSSIFGVDTVIFLFRALQRRWVAKLPTWAEGVWGGK